MRRDLDDVDRSVLYVLQQDARGTTAQEITDQVEVSASTVRNRTETLEDARVITYDDETGTIAPGPNNDETERLL